jgi:hypothetical protein
VPEVDDWEYYVLVEHNCTDNGDSAETRFNLSQFRFFLFYVFLFVVPIFRGVPYKTVGEGISFSLVSNDQDFIDGFEAKERLEKVLDGRNQPIPNTMWVQIVVVK